MKITLDESRLFDLNSTLCCGQAFRWEKKGSWWFGVVGDRLLKIRQVGLDLEFENAEEEFVIRYFRLKDDLPSIYTRISKDDHMKRVLHAFRGLRILRQEPWECLISYMCATFKSIPAIRQMIHELSVRFGERNKLDGKSFYTFPKPRALATAAITDLQKCHLGYRASYVRETAKIVSKSLDDLLCLRDVPYEMAKADLVKYPGVGLKVADCVLLFSLDKLEAFPVDTWISRALIRHYATDLPPGLATRFSDRRSSSSSQTYKALSLFGRGYFGKYAGYAQEYLYHYERTVRIQ